jgi:hypothetical protein
VTKQEAAAMQSKAKISGAIVDLSSPAPAGVTQSQVDTARRTLSWVLGQHGEKGLAEAVFGVAPAAPAVSVPVTPPAPTTSPA